MKNPPFSEALMRMLRENEVEVNSDPPFLTFNKVSLSKAILLIPAFFLSLIAIAHIQQHPLNILLIILLISFFTKVIWVGLTRKLHFQIDFSENRFKLYDYKNNLHWCFLNEIDEVMWKCQESSLSDVNKTFKISIIFLMCDHHLLNVFQFHGNHREPSPEMIELISFLENSINKADII